MENNKSTDEDEATAAAEGEPGRALPATVADLLEPLLPDMSGEILAAIAREVPEYSRPLEGKFGRGIRTGVAEALGQFVALIRNPDGRPAAGREVYVGLGRGEARQGRSLDALQSAYRVGARVAWRRSAAAGRDAGVDEEVLHLLAEAMFAYIDELSAESVEGYAQEQALREGRLGRERRRLLTLMIEGGEDARAELPALAAHAGWSVPRTVSALACDEADLDPLLRRLPAGCTGAPLAGLGCVAVPDPAGPGRKQTLQSAVDGRFAVIGLSGPPERFGSSWREAREGFGMLDGPGLRWVEDSAIELMLAAARPALDRLASRRLSPLEEMTPKARIRTLQTLDAYLRLNGRTGEMAAALGVHEQTVRYRLDRLREIFGTDLEEPDVRFELEVVLRAGVTAAAP